MKIINATKGTANPYYKVSDDAAVGDTFQEKRQTFVIVTDEQADSFEKIVRHQGRDNYGGVFYDLLGGYLGVQFKTLFIGIEPDGYAHS